MQFGCVAVHILIIVIKKLFPMCKRKLKAVYGIYIYIRSCAQSYAYKYNAHSARMPAYATKGIFS